MHQVMRRDDKAEARRLQILEALGVALGAKRQAAITHRSNSGIEQIWTEDEEHYMGIDDANRDELDKLLATMLTRLMTDTCRTEAKAAMEKDGSQAFQNAFGTIGKLAMQELMSNPEVNASFSRFAKYIDQKKMNAVFAGK